MADQTPLDQRSTEVFIDASPERVYDVISDVRRMGEWSPDVQEVYFVEGYQETAEGAKFEGKDNEGLLGRKSYCKVHTARRGEELAWEVLDGEFPLTRWRYQLHTDGEGTRVQATAELVRVPTSMKLQFLLHGGQEGRMKKLEQSMQTTLERIKESVEKEQEPHAAVA